MTDDVVEMEVEREPKLESIPDVGEDDDADEDWATKLPVSSAQVRRSSTTSMSSLWRPDARHNSETPSHDDNSVRSPSTSTTSSSQTLYPPSPSNSEWAHLPAELRHHLDYYRENITHCHYCMSSDVDDFFRLTLPGLAARDEGLLHAVVSFVAYHEALQDPNGKLDVFLAHFNRSIRILIDLFKRQQRPNVGTLLTILQLATIEVSLSCRSHWPKDKEGADVVQNWLGIPRRLDQPAWSPKGCARDTHRPLQANRHYANTTRARDSTLVSPI